MSEYLPGTCDCGHKGPQKRIDICGKCWNGDRNLKPRGKFSQYVQGTCPCGHVGWQKRIDICGPCHRDMNRVRPQTEDTREVRNIWHRSKSIVSLFQKLPEANKIKILEKLEALV